MLKLVISDLHISGGTPSGSFSPYEDFHYDEELAEFLEFYSTGEYFDMPVELILNGDILDPLKVDINGTFPDRITNAIAVQKVGRCLDGHPLVVQALRQFIRRPGKSITYIMGNHDLEIAFLSVQELIRSVIAGPDHTRLIEFRVFSPFYDLPGGIRVTHGNQFEALNRVDLKRLFMTRGFAEPVLNLPWGSIFLLKVLLPIKNQRPYINLVHPFGRYYWLAVVSDSQVAIPAGLRAAYYFTKTRFIEARQRAASFRETFRILREEAVVTPDLEEFAFALMDNNPSLTGVIMGHSHQARIRRYGKRGAMYVNTGTWTKLINLNLSDLGVHTRFTYAMVDYRGGTGEPRLGLYRWFGSQRPYSELRY
mgnify:CR=1 FL=1